MEKLPESDTYTTVIFRLLSIFVIFMYYIGFMWFYSYNTTVDKYIGFSTLVAGVLMIFLPVKTIGIKMWLSLLIFFYLSVFFKWSF